MRGLVVLAAALVALALWGSARAEGCEEVRRAVREAPSTYVVTVHIWLGEREAYYERARVAGGRVTPLEKRASASASFRLDATQPPAVPDCRSLSLLEPGVWEVRESVPEIAGERTVVYRLRGNQLSRIETSERGVVGMLFFKKAIRTAIVYEMEAPR